MTKYIIKYCPICKSKMKVEPPINNKFSFECLNNNCSPSNKIHSTWVFYFTLQNEEMVEYGIPLLFNDKIYVLNSSLVGDTVYDKNEIRTIIHDNDAHSLYINPIIIINTFIPFVSVEQSTNDLKRLLNLKSFT